MTAPGELISFSRFPSDLVPQRPSAAIKQFISSDFGSLHTAQGRRRRFSGASCRTAAKWTRSPWSVWMSLESTTSLYWLPQVKYEPAFARRSSCRSELCMFLLSVGKQGGIESVHPRSCVVTMKTSFLVCYRATAAAVVPAAPFSLTPDAPRSLAQPPSLAQHSTQGQIQGQSPPPSWSPSPPTCRPGRLSVPTCCVSAACRAPSWTSRSL